MFNNIHDCLQTINHVCKKVAPGWACGPIFLLPPKRQLGSKTFALQQAFNDQNVAHYDLLKDVL